MCFRCVLTNISQNKTKGRFCFVPIVRGARQFIQFAVPICKEFLVHVGRMHAAEKRAEMAEFIAMIRMEEAAADEEDYWRTHFWARQKRDWNLFVKSWTEKEKVSSEAELFNASLNDLSVESAPE